MIVFFFIFSSIIEHSSASTWASRFKVVCLRVQARLFPFSPTIPPKACCPWEPQRVPSRGNVCIKSWGYNHSLGLTSASSAVACLSWQPFLGYCQGTKHFLPFHLTRADPLEAEDDCRVSKTFSKTRACCPGHEAGSFSVKASLMLTMNKSSVRRRLSFIYKKSIAF